MANSFNLVEVLEMLRMAYDWGSWGRTALEESQNQIQGIYDIIYEYIYLARHAHGQFPDPVSFTAPVPVTPANSNSFSDITSSPLFIPFEHLEREQLPELPADDATELDTDEGTIEKPPLQIDLSDEDGFADMSPAILVHYESVMNDINMSREEGKILEDVTTTRKSAGKGLSLIMLQAVDEEGNMLDGTKIEELNFSANENYISDVGQPVFLDTTMVFDSEAETDEKKVDPSVGNELSVNTSVTRAAVGKLYAPEEVNNEGELARENEKSDEENTLESLVKMEAKAARTTTTANKRKSETPIRRIAKVLKISTRDNKIQGAKKRPHRNDDSESKSPLKRPRSKNVLLESSTGIMGSVVSFVRPNKRTLSIEEEESGDYSSRPKKRLNTCDSETSAAESWRSDEGTDGKHWLPVASLGNEDLPAGSHIKFKWTNKEPPNEIVEAYVTENARPHIVIYKLPRLPGQIKTYVSKMEMKEVMIYTDAQACSQLCRPY